MKKIMNTILAAALSFSLLILISGCSKSTDPEGSKQTETRNAGIAEYVEDGDSSGDTLASIPPTDSDDTRSSKYTGGYELAIPTGTREMSDDPELPEEIVYWDPERYLEPEYTLEEATERYAFVADHTTLIYNSCDELSMSHEFRCVDYGSRLFSNRNSAQCLDPDGNVHAGNITHLQLNVLENTSVYTPFEEMAHDPMCYYRLPPSEFKVEEIEQSDYHTIQHITEPDTSREFLYYGKVIDEKLILVTFENYNTDTPLTENDIRDFIHYAEVLFEHLEPDNGSEPYIYDKIVNVPILGGMHVTGFNHLTCISRKGINLETRDYTKLGSVSLIPGADEAYLEVGADGEEWTDMGDMKSKDGYAGNQALYFTVEDETYYCSIYNPDGKSTVFDSVDDLLSCISENCYLK